MLFSLHHLVAHDFVKIEKYISSNFGKQVGLFALFAITLFDFNIKFHLSCTELLTLLFVRKEEL